MECLVDDKTNCNLPDMSPRCACDDPTSSLQPVPPSTLSNDRVNQSWLVNTNNNGPCSGSDLTLPFQRLSTSGSNNPTCATTTYTLAAPARTSDMSFTNSAHFAHRARAFTTCSCPNQGEFGTDPTSSAAVHRPRSQSNPLGSQHQHRVGLFSHPHSVSAQTSPRCQHGGERLSLESYLIPDPEARAELERRLRAYSLAAGQEYPPGHGSHGACNLNGAVTTCVDLITNSSFSPSATLSQPLNLNLCHNENSFSYGRDTDSPWNSHYHACSNRSRVTPSVSLSSLSDAGSMLDSSGATSFSTPTDSLQDVPDEPADSRFSKLRMDSLSSGFGYVGRRNDELSVQTQARTSPQKSSFESISARQRLDSGRPGRESGHHRRTTRERKSKVKVSDGVWSRSELLAQLHCEPVEDQDFEDTLTDDVISSLGFHNYSIHEILGKGISSTVRRVTEKTTGVEFAVKIIDISGEKGEDDQVEQIKRDTFREIRILRMCNGHPNIIELRDVFETPTFIFLVFEICKKGELFDYLTSVISLSEKRTRIFMRQLLQAVDFFHQQDVVHRDLKPENILLDDNLNIKVSDFGFATVLEKGEELSELCGTPGYLAPEVLAHSMYENVSGYSKEVDMWACGVIMYTLLCGAPPFWHRRQMMMLRAIMSADYTFNTPEWDDISDVPKNLIQQLLVVNPQQRLTAQQALAHPFFCGQIVEDKKKFQGKRKFRVGAYCIIFYMRLGHTAKHPPPILVSTVRENPYSIKMMRKAIDASAFGMYKHWVKRVENQNRAAMFEHTLRDDWRKGNLATLNREGAGLRFS